MPILPPTSVYPVDYDTNSTLYRVYNTTETHITQQLLIGDTEIFIEPVEAGQPEIWADNGFATISGEAIYYGSVLKNVNNKVYKLENCIRNQGGNPPQYNPAQTEIRSFVMAEHHNELARSIVNTENFLGIDQSTIKSTLDWRIRYLVNQPNLTDDYGCPEVNFTFYTVSENPLTGTVINYELEIIGVYESFILEFGDGTSTSTDLSGTHSYPPNSTIDPIITVESSSCQTVNSDVARSLVNEGLVQFLPQDLNVTLDSIPDFDDILIEFEPNIAANINLPPIVFPCLDIGPFGPISIPSTITIDPPVVIPSTIVFNNPPVIPSTISVSPFSVVVSGDKYIDLVCIPIAGVKGFAIGGSNSSNVAVDRADKVTYVNDTFSQVPSANITGSARFGSAGCADGTYGYIAGGYSSAILSSFYRTQFSTEVTSAFSTVNLSSSTYYPSAISGQNTKGYFAGGITGSGGPSNKIDVLDFANSTISSLQMPTGRFQFGAITLEQQKGYFCGGSTGSTGVVTTDIISYADDTFSSPTTASLKSPRMSMSGIDGNTIQGYFVGGSASLTGAILKTIEKMNYSYDATTAITSSQLTTGRRLAGGISDQSSRGYIAGGLSGQAASTVQTSVERLSTTGDLISALQTGLSLGRAAMACISQNYVNPSDTTGDGTTGGNGAGDGTTGGGTTGGNTTGDITTGGCGTCEWVAVTEFESTTVPPTYGGSWQIASNNCTGGCRCSGPPPNWSGRTAPANITTNCVSGFALTNNGYSIPEEAFITPTPDDFSFASHGYNAVTQQQNDFVKNVQQAFDSVKVRIKEETLLPNVKDLLGD